MTEYVSKRIGCSALIRTVGKCEPLFFQKVGSCHDVIFVTPRENLPKSEVNVKTNRTKN